MFNYGREKIMDRGKKFSSIKKGVTPMISLKGGTTHEKSIINGERTRRRNDLHIRGARILIRGRNPGDTYRQRVPEM